MKLTYKQYRKMKRADVIIKNAKIALVIVFFLMVLKALEI